MTPPQLTKEQKQFFADMLAEMLAENAKSAKPKRIMLDTPHDTTEVYNLRLPLDMGAALIEMGKELNASRSYIVYTLLHFAITTSLTDQMQGIASTSAFQKYRKDFR
jgi:hypothetical protein